MFDVLVFFLLIGINLRNNLFILDLIEFILKFLVILGLFKCIYIVFRYDFSNYFKFNIGFGFFFFD